MEETAAIHTVQKHFFIEAQFINEFPIRVTQAFEPREGNPGLPISQNSEMSAAG